MKFKLLSFFLVLQTVWILGITFQQERALRAGKTMLLETERVDPRDLLRGDYIILNYKISSVPTNLFVPPVNNDSPYGTAVFVALRPGGDGFQVVARASASRFVPAADEILIVGKSSWQRWNETNSVHVEYGLERFYVAEGTGNPVGKLTVEAVVPASGRASIKQVFVDGRPYAEAMKK